jgi:hypothetical protein
MNDLSTAIPPDTACCCSFLFDSQGQFLYSQLLKKRLLITDGIKTASLELSLLLGCGAIYSINDRFYAVSEFNYQSEGDYMLITGRIDYELKIDKQVTTAIGIGLDDGAPDLTFMLSYSHAF